MCNTCDVKYSDYYSENIYTWCTNCGNYGITAAVKRALADSDLHPKDVLLCFDIGCHGNGSDKIGAYSVHGLHGRVIPFAAGAALASKKIKVIAFGGDGGTLSEGINHLVHAIRSNYDMTFILHNNSNYGLTKGQASSTTRADIPMDSSPDGITADTLHVMNFVLNLHPAFAARTFSGDVKQMTAIFKAAIEHKGFSFIEVLQHCPTYNKATPHEWYQQRVYDTIFAQDYDNTNLAEAIKVAQDIDKNIATGVLYVNNNKKDFLARQSNREKIQSDLREEVKNYDIANLLKRFL